MSVSAHEKKKNVFPNENRFFLLFHSFFFHLNNVHCENDLFAMCLMLNVKNWGNFHIHSVFICHTHRSIFSYFLCVKFNTTIWILAAQKYFYLHYSQKIWKRIETMKSFTINWNLYFLGEEFFSRTQKFHKWIERNIWINIIFWIFAWESH
jgi:hypothetical protein